MIARNELRTPMLVIGISMMFAGDRCSIQAGEGLPNIVLIVADDLGYGDLSCYDGWIQTPHIDQLASQGIRFLDFHSNGVVCSPTRASLMTGAYPQRVGIPWVVAAAESAATHRLGLADKWITLPEWLRQRGYATALFGKWHLGYLPQFHPMNHGFDQFRGYVSGNVDYFSHVDQAGHFDWWNGRQKEDDDGYVTRLLTKYAVNYIQQHRDAAFFLLLAHEAPHYPYQGPGDRAERTVGGSFPSHGTRSDPRNAYREMVSELDDSVGRVLDALANAELQRKTIVWFLSDNGATRLGSNGRLRGHKGTVWEGGQRVPAIVSWPGNIPPGTCPTVMASMDVLPTIAGLLGLSPPANQVDGRDQHAALLGGSETSDRKLYWQYGEQAAVRDGRWKLVQPRQRAPQLFDLSRDLGEAQDLAAEYPERQHQLQAALDHWRREISRP